MTSAIEVIDWHQLEGIRELATEIYANEEPCFQIDGVQGYDQLKTVFNALQSAVPEAVTQRIKFNDAFYKTENGINGFAHVDVSFKALALHQNLQDIIAIEMGTSNSSYYLETPKGIDSDHAHNIRTGNTIPGRLTVFSQGNLPEIGLLPTVHFFDRKEEPKPKEWIRYATARGWLTPYLSQPKTYAIKRTALEGFAFLELEAA